MIFGDFEIFRLLGGGGRGVTRFDPPQILAKKCPKMGQKQPKIAKNGVVHFYAEDD